MFIVVIYVNNFFFSDSRSTCELSEDDQDIFTALITNAKQRTTEGNIKDALDLYKQALKMYYNEKLERKIHKMEVKYWSD